MPSPALSPGSTVSVIGGGTMGAGIAQVAAAAGHEVLLLDSRAGAAAKAVEGIRGMFERLAAKGKMTPDAARAAGARLRAADGLGETAGSALAIEAIVEDLDAKRRLFADLEAVVGAGCILATNTSSLSVTAIAAAL
jgi:3-hydroxybutyryl-CoA dehydrogenase